MFKRLKIALASLNNNDWGRGSQKPDTPPDPAKEPPPKPRPGYGANPELEELWANINERLGDLFGKKNDKNNPNNNSGNGNGKPNTPFQLGFNPWFLIAVPVVLWLASGFFIVQEAQRGVILTFGAYSETVGPGFRWRAPWPIQSNEVVNISQIRKIEIGYRNNIKNKIPEESLMLTNDENLIDVQVTVQFRLKSPEDYLFNNLNTDHTIKLSVESALREIIGRYKMDFILYEAREKVAQDTAALAQEILDRYKTGVLLSGVILQNAQPPEPVQSAFDDAVKAGQDRDRQKNEGESYANDVIPKAKGMAARMLEDAAGYSARVVGNAEGDAERFNQVVAEYQRAPAVTRSRMYLETMQQVFSNVTKVMVESKQGNNLLYLPLDKIMKENAATNDATGSSKAAPSTITPTTGSGPARDLGQERLRELR